MDSTFEMVAKTFRGLEDVLAEELRGLGASDVMPGNRMVSFSGDKAMLYKANMCCRTALRVLKPIYKFRAADSDELYERVRDFDWSTLLSPEKTFAIDTVAFGEEFTHSRFVTYRVKDAVVDWFRDRHGNNCRPQVRLAGADSMTLLFMAGCIIIFKSLITSATNSGGGVGGDFAPTLFAGAMAGLFFVMLLNMYFGTQLDSGNFAYYAMAGVMAGAIHAPLMAIFLTVEMTGQYTLLLPLTIVAAISYGIVKLFRDKNFLIDRIEFWYRRHEKQVSPRNNDATPVGKS